MSTQKKEGVLNPLHEALSISNPRLLLGSFLDAVVHGLPTFLFGAAFLVAIPARFLGASHGQRFLRLPFFFNSGCFGLA